jgi:hypothetical protein
MAATWWGASTTVALAGPPHVGGLAGPVSPADPP